MTRPLLVAVAASLAAAWWLASPVAAQTRGPISETSRTAPPAARDGKRLATPPAGQDQRPAAQPQQQAQRPAASAPVEPKEFRGIRHFLFVADAVERFGGYRRHAAIYKPGETLRIYGEPVEFGWSRTDAAASFRIDISWAIRRVDGAPIFDQSAAVRIDAVAPQPSPETFFNFHVTAALEPGQYVLALKIRDPANSRQVVRELPFIVAATDTGN